MSRTRMIWWLIISFFPVSSHGSAPSVHQETAQESSSGGRVDTWRGFNHVRFIGTCRRINCMSCYVLFMLMSHILKNALNRWKTKMLSSKKTKISKVNTFFQYGWDWKQLISAWLEATEPYWKNKYRIVL